MAATRSPAPKSFGTPRRSERLDDASVPPPIAPVVEKAVERLLSCQRDDGHWCAELEGDTILESEYILLQTFLGRASSYRVAQCARYLADKQGADGGWSNFPNGPADVSVSVKAYFALKIAGYRADSERMLRARQCILDLGGAEACNSFTRFYLAALGQIPYRHCPSVPPELVLLPKWCPINLYKMSAWTRTIVVPLSIFYAYKPVVSIPKEQGIAELFRVPPTADQLPQVARLERRLFSWPNVFRLVDRSLKLVEHVMPRFLRRRALRAAEQWMLERFDGSDGLGAIFPPMVYTLIALKCLGYAEDSTEFRWAEKQLDDLIIDDGENVRIQPCLSPVWDTAWAMIALADAGVGPQHPALQRAADWLLAREVRTPGDWAVSNPHLEPSGWAFEYHNRFYPDIDDTAIVLTALRRTSRFSDDDAQRAVHRALCFVLGMQCRDRGWAAFDKDIDNHILEAIPFADHNAMLDPSCPDITARVLEMLGNLGYRRGKSFIDDAIRFIFDHQEPEGCWFGRWGVNYIYGTWQVLVGLNAIGYDMRHPKVRKAVEWLLSVQHAEGSWGESCASYSDRRLMGQGEPTPSQTAWAILALLAAGEASHPAVARGVHYLARTQRPDGGWDERPFTGTGFPKVFYLKYHYYSLYFPLLALARYEAAQMRETAPTPAVLQLTRAG